MEVKMKVKSFLWSLLVILTVSSGHTLFAQGESAVPFLLIAPGARAGGCFRAHPRLRNLPRH